jgi:hypothetical protein
MALKFRSPTTRAPETTPSDNPSDGGSAPASDGHNIMVSHGIHRGRFPVGGMMVRDARRVLEKLIILVNTSVVFFIV